MNKKIFLSDLSILPSSWGEKVISIQFFQAIFNKGYNIKVICDNWNNPGQGVTFTDMGEEIEDKSGYLYDPNSHPKDFFENLIKFTFSGEITVFEVLEKTIITLIKFSGATNDMYLLD